MKSLRIALLCFSIFSLNQAFSQMEEITFEVKVVEYTTSKKLEGAYVKVFLGDTKELKSLQTDTTGLVSFSLKSCNRYKIVIGGENKVERYFIVDLRKVTDEYLAGMSTLNGACQVSLFDRKPDVDYSYILKNPVTRFSPNEKFSELVFDTELAKKMAVEIERIMALESKK